MLCCRENSVLKNLLSKPKLSLLNPYLSCIHEIPGTGNLIP